MNFRRGLFRLWLLSSIAWIVFCSWLLDFQCFVDNYPECAWWVYEKSLQFPDLALYLRRGACKNLWHPRRYFNCRQSDLVGSRGLPKKYSAKQIT